MSGNNVTLFLLLTVDTCQYLLSLVFAYNLEVYGQWYLLKVVRLLQQFQSFVSDTLPLKK